MAQRWIYRPPQNLKLNPNEFVTLTNAYSSPYGTVGKHKNGLIVPLEYRTVVPSGITPHSDWQRMMVEAFLSKSRPISVIAARAGAGKTLMALACALHLRAAGDIRHIAYIIPDNDRPPVPGDAKKKLEPYAQGLRDALFVIDHALRSAEIQRTASAKDSTITQLEILFDKLSNIVTLAASVDKEGIAKATADINHIITQAIDQKEVFRLNGELGALYEYLKPIEDARTNLSSLRNGNLNKLFIEISKSAKSMKKALGDINAPSPNNRSQQHATDIIDRYQIEIMNLDQLSSRSLIDTFAIIDEAQFLRLEDIDKAGSRPSKNSHVAFLGDARQTYAIDKFNTINGMLILTQTQMRSHSTYILTIPPTVRSERRDAADFIAALEDVTQSNIAESMI